MATPYSVMVLEEVASTQDLARRVINDRGPAVVIAHRQSRGRGRSGASWETSPRAVAVSVAFHSPAESTIVPLLGGVAARRVLGESVSLKWPNDVMVGDAKVAGILVEASGQVVVAGMGVNLHWPDPPSGADGLFDSDPGMDRGPEVARAWSEELLGLVEENEWPRLEYVGACSTLGLDITWEPSGSGRAVDVGVDGALVVVDSDGIEQRLSSGAVSHVRTR